jgi:uncharacterized protein with GYD domain
MARFIMLTQVEPGAAGSPDSVAGLGERMRQCICDEFPDAHFVESYVVLGPYDCVDIIEAPDMEVAGKIAARASAFQHTVVEMMPATPWKRYCELSRSKEPDAAAQRPAAENAGRDDRRPRR